MVESMFVVFHFKNESGEDITLSANYHRQYVLFHEHGNATEKLQMCAQNAYVVTSTPELVVDSYVVEKFRCPSGVFAWAKLYRYNHPQREAHLPM